MRADRPTVAVVNAEDAGWIELCALARRLEGWLVLEDLEGWAFRKHFLLLRCPLSVDIYNCRDAFNVPLLGGGLEDLAHRATDPIPAAFPMFWSSILHLRPGEVELPLEVVADRAIGMIIIRMIIIGMIIIECNIQLK